MGTMFSAGIRVVSFFFCLIFIGCASDIYRVPVEFASAAEEAGRNIILATDTAVAPSNSYSRTLKADSKWKFVGRIPQGSVLEIQDDVFMLEAKNMHQAHLVLSSGDRLVGFFLPVEQAFVPITPSIQLSVKGK